MFRAIVDIVSSGGGQRTDIDYDGHIVSGDAIDVRVRGRQTSRVSGMGNQGI